MSKSKTKYCIKRIRTLKIKIKIKALEGYYLTPHDKSAVAWVLQADTH